MEGGVRVMSGLCRMEYGKVEGEWLLDGGGWREGWWRESGEWMVENGGREGGGRVVSGWWRMERRRVERGL